MTLPEGWADTTIGEVAETKLGKMLDATKNKGEPATYLRNVNVRWGAFDLSDLLEMRVTADEREALSVRDGDLFMCEGGEPGRCAVWRGGERDLVFQKAIHRVRPFEAVEADYLATHIAHLAAEDALSHLFTGTTIKHLPQVALQRISLPLPPAAEQRRIIAKLDALTIRLARARTELDRVTALASRLKHESRRRAFENDGTRYKLSEITPPDAAIIYGILQPGPNTDGGVPYVRPSEIDAGVIQLAEVRRTTPGIAAQYRRSTVRTGDLILTIVGTIGKVAEVPAALDGGNITQSSCRVRVDERIADRGYVRHWLQSPQAWLHYDAGRLGTAVPRLNLRDIRDFTIGLPDINTQRRIAAELDTGVGRADRLEAEATRARALIDRLEAAILARAFRGELVPQDPADEPASVLLDRIRAERAAAPKPKRGRGTKMTAGA